MNKIVLTKIIDDDEPDGLSADDQAMIAQLVRAGPLDDDPEINALVAATLADMRKGASVVEFRKSGVANAPSAARIARVEAGIAKLETYMQTRQINELAAEALRLTKSGSRENVLKAGMLLEDEAVYEAFREADARAAEEARRRPPAQVGKRGGRGVDEMITKANALRIATPGLTMAQAMDRVEAEHVTLAKLVNEEMVAL
jgi:hypothetical protein